MAKVKDNLNPNQREAVIHRGGPLLVLAGAGSGKTRIITERIAHLVKSEKEPPESILAVTFTNKAANEMKERVNSLIGAEAKRLWIGTFHSVCLRILKREITNLEGFGRDFIIYDDADQIKLIKNCMAELNISDRTHTPRALRSRIDSAKNKGLGPEDLKADVYEETVSKIYALYEQELRKANALDFSDLLHVTVRLFGEKREILKKYQGFFRHILVDEYQDTNHVQYKIVELLSKKHRNLFVVGDDNQSIYGWRGADITNILNFEKDYTDTRIIKLERNYRSTKTILSASNKLISNNTQRHEKELWTENAEGELISYFAARNEKDEAKYVAAQIQSEAARSAYSYKDIAVFYRTNTQSRQIEEELIYRRIPYKIVGGIGFYQRAEVKDVLAYLRVIANPLDEISLRRIINVPPRGIGKGTLEKLDEIAVKKGVSLFEALRLCAEDQALPRGASIKLKKFYDLITGLISYSGEHGIGELLDLVLQKSGYLDILEREPERRENVGELFNIAAEFEKEGGNVKEGDNAKEKEGSELELNDFLDRVSLSSDLDSFNEKTDQVALMTLHSAKGLEFPVTFIIGLEENLLPHFNSARDGEIEEERRLLYVGLTRAKEKIYLTSSARRLVFGKEETPAPSRFLTEIPDEFIKWNVHKESFIETSVSTGRKSAASDKTQRKESYNGKRYKIGQQIEHQKFGLGTVRKVEGSGEKAKISVQFPRYGMKKIIASYLEGK
jgi:DNA helicase-2/ATP-dependent DNA helicase PcrA